VSEVSKELLVSKIKNGTVIDHIPAGRAFAVLKILGITGKEGLRVAIVMNVESKRIGRKDIVKIEERELKGEEVDLIKLIAPSATINIVRDYDVVEKRRPAMPKRIRKRLSCVNPTCITNNDPQAQSDFVLVLESPLKLKCNYCSFVIDEDTVLRQIA
jgi:aspartate carbamoyltransferase regulatory subunit